MRIQNNPSGLKPASCKQAPEGYNHRHIMLPSVPMALVATVSKVFPITGRTLTRDSMKYVLRGLLTPRLTRQWFQLLLKPELALVTKNCPRIFSKLQRPYLHRKMRPALRLQALKQHYGFLSERLSAAALERIYSKPGVKLAELALEDIGKFSVRLFYWNRFEKEGELTLGLMDDEKEAILFALSFTLWKSTPSAREIFVGGLQGIKKSNEREDVVAITRGMHGLRPKALLLFALQQIAAAWNVTSIRATSNDMSVFSHIRLQHKKMLASYDAFWVESDGCLASDGLFTLPSRFAPRPVTDIKPNKRSLYKKRYAMLANLNEQISSHVQQLDKIAS